MTASTLTSGIQAAPGIWKAYNPSTGEWMYTMTNVPSGTQYFGPSGEILIYQIDYANRWMALWNSTAAGQRSINGTWRFWQLGQIRTWIKRGTQAAQETYSWNVTIPAGLTAGTSFFAPILKVYPDRVMSVDFNQTRVRVWALSTAAGSQRTHYCSTNGGNAPAEWLARLEHFTLCWRN